MANSFCDRRMDSSPQVRSMHSRFSVRSPTVSVSKTTSPWRRVRRPSGQQLGGGEGLGHVVVGAGVVAADFVAYGIAGGEQQNGRAHALGRRWATVKPSAFGSMTSRMMTS